MKAMILAAGLGKRMRPLTDHLPKPLLEVAGQPLIVHHLLRLQHAGVTDVVINVSYLGHMICDALGDGSDYGMSIYYSVEAKPLETGGALNKALYLLGDEPFLLINGDVWCDIPLGPLLQTRLQAEALGHLVLVPNPDFKAVGDFSLSSAVDGLCRLALRAPDDEGYTFSGLSVLSPALISSYPLCRDAFPLLEVLLWGLDSGALTAELYKGTWVDVGTPDRLTQLDAIMRS